MSARVTSITHLRARTRRRDEISMANTRLSVTVMAIVGVLMIIGLGATMSASSVEGILQESNNLAIFTRQLRWVGVGTIVMLIAVKVPYTLYRRLAAPILLASIVSLLAVPAFGVNRGGSTRWLEFGSITVQPSEFSKFAVVAFLAAVLSKKADLLANLGHFLAPVAASIGVVAALVVLQPDLGTALVIASAGGAVVIASKAPARFVAATAVLGGGVALGAALLVGYRKARVLCFLDPLSDPLGDCFQLKQSLVALGSGNLFGVGLGASRARWSYLPNAHTDFIYTIIAEETGFIGAIGLLTLFAGISVAGVIIAYRTSDPFARLLAVGITAWITTQALVNIGGVVGVMPITGMALPFVSVGGSAMIAALGGIGVLVNVAQTAPGTRSVS